MNERFPTGFCDVAFLLPGFFYGVFCGDGLGDALFCSDGLDDGLICAAGLFDDGASLGSCGPLHSG